ncbi:Putative L-serine dehydratase [Aspergillus calidoustus]|uniref:L-serine ammonia-lyase n=1 Tax=Aspergillus calidoustus TaxID=454130 RepID=A0A0U5GPY1_ASPCI|nr:Putative L-serine dehydratase [Aspergillus calidoustus]
MAHTEKKPWIETPLIESTTLSKTAGCRVFLKLELLQPSGSFKSRGIGNLISNALQDPANAGKQLHCYSSSGGNAGLAAVYAARDLDCPCSVIVPHSTKPMMIQKLRDAGATDVIQHGDSWFQADTYLRKTFIENQDDWAETRSVYVPPFDHPDIWQGAATMVDEIERQMPAREEGGFPADVVVCSVGGGGLFNGVVEGLGRHMQSRQDGEKVRVLAVETKGADSLALAIKSGGLKSLPAITSLATSLGALQVAPQTLKNAQSPPAGVEVSSVVGSDAEAARGSIRLADALRLQAELACGISVEVGSSAARLKEFVPELTPETRVVVIVCGGSNITAEMLAQYREKLQEGWS